MNGLCEEKDSLQGPRTAVKWEEKSLADLILGLFELVHEDNAALAIVASEIVVDNRAVLPPLIRAPRAKEIRLTAEIGAVNILEIKGQQATKVPG